MNREQLLATEDIKRLLLKYSIPAIIGMLVNALYNIVDRIYIAKIKDVGSVALTGLGVTFPIITIILAFSLLIGVGATSTISIRLGQQRREEAEHTLGNALTLVVIFSLMITFIGLLFIDKLLYAFGASETTFVYAKDYIVIFLGGSIFNMVASSLNHTIRGAGNPKRAASTMLLGAALNVVLDPIFIFVFGWGVKGAAWATVISQAVSAAWVFSYFISGKSTLKLKISNMKLKKDIVLGIFAIGMSPFAMQLAASLVTATANKSLRFYGGDIAIGAMTAISSVYTLFLMPILGITQGLQPIAGYNYGAKNYDRVKKALVYSVVASSVICFAGALSAQLFPKTIISMFNKDIALLEIGSRGIRIFLLMLPLLGFQVTCTNFFQNIGKAKKSMFLSLLRQVIILTPLYIILPRFFNLDGIWMSGPISDFVSFLVTMVLIMHEFKTLKTE